MKIIVTDLIENITKLELFQFINNKLPFLLKFGFKEESIELVNISGKPCALIDTKFPALNNQIIKIINEDEHGMKAREAQMRKLSLDKVENDRRADSLEITRRE